MKYLPFDARVVLIDGPVALFIHEAPAQAILDAYERLGRLAALAAQQLHKEDENATPAQPRATTYHDSSPVLSANRSPGKGGNA